ncbi:MAG: hypothetical protein G01um101466_102 [Parcubacteria group bacterium Gr01-1014_66]|nr:MAG: hypothetical protein G01um101466_102 [Parcubacteria group bacterium Gr01-1014_66]
MELLILFYALIFNVVRDHRKVAVLTYCVGVVSRCPEVASPQKAFYLGMSLEDVSGGDAFDLFDQI